MTPLASLAVLLAGASTVCAMSSAEFNDLLAQQSLHKGREFMQLRGASAVAFRVGETVERGCHISPYLRLYPLSGGVDHVSIASSGNVQLRGFWPEDANADQCLDHVAQSLPGKCRVGRRHVECSSRPDVSLEAGTYAMNRNESGLNLYRWAPDAVPEWLRGPAVDWPSNPAAWGEPVLEIPSGPCNLADRFADLKVRVGFYVCDSLDGVKWTRECVLQPDLAHCREFEEKAKEVVDAVADDIVNGVIGKGEAPSADAETETEPGVKAKILGGSLRVLP